MEPKSLYQLTDEVVMTFERYNAQKTTPWNYRITSQDLMYQVGSLTKLIMQLDGDRYADGQSPEALKSQIQDEIADILADTLFVAHELGIDPYKGWEGMLESDKKKVESRSSSVEN